ncbi:MAG: Gfo/Idh/MocA family oxidoreductase [Bacillota bacterium]|nr:Gfo/Idh/MocA family oxidoreductase [Bacillota bacterium]
MKKLRSAIIGCGNIHVNHAKALMNSDFGELAAVVDINENRAKAAAEKYNCKYYLDYKEMLKDNNIDVVHICTPHFLHSTMAIDSIAAGKHALVEKPVAVSVERAMEMIAAKDKYKKHLAVAFQNRYNNTSLKAKEIIEQGTLGKVRGLKAIVTWSRDKNYYLNDEWRGKWETEGGGVLINQAIHDLDLLQWFGGPMDSIKGNADLRVLNDVIEVEDTADATIRFKSGAVGIFYATNCYSMNSSVLIEIHLEDGMLRIEEGELFLIRDGAKTLLCSDTSSDSTAKSYWGEGHRKMIKSFYESIMNDDTKGYVTGEESIKSLQIIEGIYKSSLNKEIVLR